MTRTPHRVLALALVLGGCATRSERRPDPRVTLAPCQIGSPGSPVRIAAECETWSVAEDRKRPESRRIDLRIAIVRVVSRNPAPDPLVFLTGGPGQTATESYVTLRAAFRRINRDSPLLAELRFRSSQSNHGLLLRFPGPPQARLLFPAASGQPLPPSLSQRLKAHAL